jgi:hypothetical protein
LFANLARALLPLTVSKIDYTGNVAATDSAWFYHDIDGNLIAEGGGSFPAVEHDHTRLPHVDVDRIVTLRTATSVQVSFTVYNPNSRSVTAHFKFENALFRRTTSTQADVSLGGSLDEDNITVPGTGSFTRTITLTGFPTVVCAGDIYAELTVTSPDCGGILPDTGPLQHIYRVNSQPEPPMETPWTEVLDYSCDFADGKSDSADCTKWCAKGLFNAGLFLYDASTSRWIEMSGAESGKFKLLAFAGTTTWPAAADCRDVSAFLQLCATSLGCDCTLRQVWTGQASNGVIVPFRTNPIKGIGLGSYTNTVWNFHQVLLLDDNVYDACSAQQKLWSDASAYNDVPTGWPQGGYWQSANGNTFVGLVDGYVTNHPASITAAWTSAFVHGPNNINTDTMLSGVK